MVGGVEDAVWAGPEAGLQVLTVGAAWCQASGHANERHSPVTWGSSRASGRGPRCLCAARDSGEVSEAVLSLALLRLEVWLWLRAATPLETHVSLSGMGKVRLAHPSSPLL
ncbi:hypothetical protein NDU88_010758 [Pleurodeles waltl]|uniref:Uncharacterized protein n=1 Tax=Pleurodeles waltl TaxID=8319 RepID=A0AAV7QZ47_PLEWA|nr:hypothetical protein NDU88_010758 [Pleurodeles waltl]